MIRASSEKGQRIFKFLQKELQVPDHVRSLDVHLSPDALITVNCEYYPKDDDKEQPKKKTCSHCNGEGIEPTMFAPIHIVNCRKCKGEGQVNAE